MVLRYATNLKLAKELYDASKPKLKGDQGMIDTFTNTFGLPENSVKLAGGVEAAAAGLFAASFLNKNISSVYLSAGWRGLNLEIMMEFIFYLTTISPFDFLLKS